MKCFMVLILLAVLLCLALGSCTTQDGYQNEKTGQILSTEEFGQLTSEQKIDFFAVKYKELNPVISGKIDTGLTTTGGVVQVIRPLIPEPYATGVVSVLAIAGTLWGIVKNKKTTGILNQVKLGAQITADSVDKVIKPSIELYEKFKERQKGQSENTDAIMPDKVFKAIV